jgi:hypothetical protein
MSFQNSDEVEKEQSEFASTSENLQSNDSEADDLDVENEDDENYEFNLDGSLSGAEDESVP